ncbi:hypothetical protein D3C85_831520 [compost metagenome]
MAEETGPAAVLDNRAQLLVLIKPQGFAVVAVLRSDQVIVAVIAVRTDRLVRGALDIEQAILTVIAQKLSMFVVELAAIEVVVKHRVVSGSCRHVGNTEQLTGIKGRVCESCPFGTIVREVRQDSLQIIQYIKHERLSLERSTLAIPRQGGALAVMSGQPSTAVIGERFLEQADGVLL